RARDRRPGGAHALHGGHGQARRARRRARAHVRVGRRRHERQHPPRAVRGAVPRGGRGPGVGRRAGPRARGGQALRERRHRGPRGAAPRRRAVGRPARGARDGCVRALDGVQLQPPDAPARRGGARRREPRARAARDGRRPPRARRGLRPGPRAGRAASDPWARPGRRRAAPYPVPAAPEPAGHDPGRAHGVAPVLTTRGRSVVPPAAESHPPLRVALLGCGVVGTQVARLLTEQADDLASRVGARLELVGIAVRDVTAPRDAAIDRALLTDDAEGLVQRADIVVEVMGGTEPARTLLLRAIEAGAAVVTANKALLAEDGPTLYKAADAAGVDIYFEAAVAGAIPIVRPVRESLAGDHVRRVLGIVNGTTNSVLDQMATTGMDLEQAVKEAQALGYAEADPTADVEGYDAAAKAAILASLAFHTRVSLDDVAREGILSVTADDVAWAAQT